jgi:hypothetical protein
MANAGVAIGGEGLQPTSDESRAQTPAHCAIIGAEGSGAAAAAGA